MSSTPLPDLEPDADDAWRGVAAEDTDDVSAGVGLRLRARSRRLLGSMVRPYRWWALLAGIVVVISELAYLVGPLAAAAQGDLGGVAIELSGESAVTVVVAGPDYPASSDYAGAPIAGIDEAEQTGALVFHGGTAMRDGHVVTNGGRILSVTALGNSIKEARERAYAAVDLVSFEGAQARRDIAAVAGG